MTNFKNLIPNKEEKDHTIIVTVSREAAEEQLQQQKLKSCKVYSPNHRDYQFPGDFLA